MVVCSFSPLFFPRLGFELVAESALRLLPAAGADLPWDELGLGPDCAAWRADRLVPAIVEEC